MIFYLLIVPVAGELGEDFNSLSVDQEEPFESCRVEKSETEFEWYADIFTYEGTDEIEMLYVFEDPDEALLEFSEQSPVYDCSFTDQKMYPIVQGNSDELRLKIFIPLPNSLEHEISEFPSSYLEEVRDEVYDQIIRSHV